MEKDIMHFTTGDDDYGFGGYVENFHDIKHFMHEVKRMIEKNKWEIEISEYSEQMYAVLNEEGQNAFGYSGFVEHDNLDEKYIGGYKWIYLARV